MITNKSHKANYSSAILVQAKILRSDPTRTTTLRKRFVAEMTRRFVRIERLIKAAVVEQDVFGLVSRKRELDVLAAVLPGAKAYEFKTSSQKVESFMGWLNTQVDKELLTTVRIEQIGTATNAAWTNVFIKDSYKQGVTRANLELRKNKAVSINLSNPEALNVAMHAPYNVDRLGLLYTRTFNDVKGITEHMKQVLSRTLAQGMADGDGPGAIANKLVKSMGISKNRAKTLARTEIVRAHHAANIQEYRNYGVAGVNVKAEWVTAGFGVCPKCSSMEGNTFSLNEIEGMIPLHPNCRCIAIPVSKKDFKKI